MASSRFSRLASICWRLCTGAGIPVRWQRVGRTWWRLHPRAGDYPELTGILKPRAKVFWQLLEETGGPKRVRDEPEWVAALMRRSGRDFLLPAKITAVISSAETLGMPMLPVATPRRDT